MFETSASTYARAFSAEKNIFFAAGNYDNTFKTKVAKALVIMLTLGIGYGIIHFIEICKNVKPKVKEFCDMAPLIHQGLRGALKSGDSNKATVKLTDGREIEFTQDEAKHTVTITCDGIGKTIDGTFDGICLKLEADFKRAPGLYPRNDCVKDDFVDKKHPMVPSCSVSEMPLEPTRDHTTSFANLSEIGDPRDILLLEKRLKASCETLLPDIELICENIPVKIEYFFAADVVLRMQNALEHIFNSPQTVFLLDDSKLFMNNGGANGCQNKMNLGNDRLKKLAQRDVLKLELVRLLKQLIDDNQGSEDYVIRGANAILRKITIAESSSGDLAGKGH